jgi:hypothetical protein
MTDGRDYWIAANAVSNRSTKATTFMYFGHYSDSVLTALRLSADFPS